MKKLVFLSILGLLSTAINNDNGIYLISNSPARVYHYPSGNGLNFIITGNNGIYAESQCNVTVAGNDITAYSSGDYAVRARYNVVVAAQGNYWGGCPVDPNDFYASDGATIIWQPLECSPLTGWGASSMSSAFAKTSSLTQENGPAGEGLALDERLMAALKHLIEGRYEEAIFLYKEAFKEESKLAVRQYILAQLAEGYRLAGKRDFIDSLNNDVRQNSSIDDELYATSLELENLFLISDGKYDQAIANFKILKSRFAQNEITHKNALFGLGYVHHVLRDDAGQAKEYFDELKAKYPDDVLTWSAMLLLGEIDGLPAFHVDLKNGPVVSSEKREMPERYSVHGNYPNPFNPATTISYALPYRSSVEFVIYDIMGRKVRSFNFPSQAPGYQSIIWNGTDETGKSMANGVYVYRMVANSLQNSESFMTTARLMLLK